MNILSGTFSGKTSAYPSATAEILNRSPKWQTFLRLQKEFSIDVDDKKNGKVVRKQTQSLNAIMMELPPEVVQVTVDQLLSVINHQEDTVSFEKHAMALWFMLTRVKASLKGPDRVNTKEAGVKVPNPEKLRYTAYNAVNGAKEPVPSYRGIDIPDTFTIFREGKPFIYKAKYHPARQFGMVDFDSEKEYTKEELRDVYSDHNQVLKFQAAIDAGLISGACIEVRGRIDLEFLKWACGTNVFNPGAVPEVQIIYNMMLPSGAEYRFNVKKSSSRNRELSIENDRHSYTSEDLDVIRGIEIALENPSQYEIYDLISGHSVFSPTGSLSKAFNAVGKVTYDKIKDPQQYDAFMNQVRQGLYDRAKAIKPELYNLNDNTVFVAKNIDLENDPAQMNKLIDEYQESLHRNAHMLRSKANYVLGPLGSEEYNVRRADVRDVMAKNIAMIRAQELARRHSPEYKELDLQRKAMGWKGPDEGIGLSVEHIMLDSIAEVMGRGDTRKKGRSYEDSQTRFMNIDDVMAHLEREKDRVVIQIRYHDPLAFEIAPNKKKISTDYADASPQKLNRLKKDQQRENIKRALAYLDGPLQKYPTERRFYDACKSRVDELRETLLACKSDIQSNTKRQSDERRKLKLRELPDDHPLVAEQKVMLGLLNNTEDSLWNTLEPVFDDRTKKKMFVEVFARRTNVMKFIYAIRSDNTAVYDEESRADANGMRASHSELIGGEFGYGAGEIVFTRDEIAQRWLLTEINNGSGHYRPPTQSLSFSSSVILSELNGFFRQTENAEQAEKSVAQLAHTCRLTDAIARGRHLRDAEVVLPKAKMPAPADTVIPHVVVAGPSAVTL